MESYDPAGHLKIAVSNYATSRKFYAGLFERLKYENIKDNDTGATWVTPSGFGILITPAEIDTAALPHGAPGIHHLCLKATSSEQVDDIATWLKESEAKIYEGPAEYPQYKIGYYAIFFADPDGIKLEVACY